jgi:hypothetical protein
MLIKQDITPYHKAVEVRVESQVTLSRKLTQDVLGVELNSQQLIPQGKSGLLVYPADNQMTLLIKSFDRMVNFTLFKQVDEIRIDQMHWDRHANLDQAVTLVYTIDMYQPALSCVNVWWRGQMLDTNSQQLLCSYRRCQRWYNV